MFHQLRRCEKLTIGMYPVGTLLGVIAMFIVHGPIQATFLPYVTTLIIKAQDGSLISSDGHLRSFHIRYGLTNCTRGILMFPRVHTSFWTFDLQQRRKTPIHLGMKRCRYNMAQMDIILGSDSPHRYWFLCNGSRTRCRIHGFRN